jgi:hypothetical protein
MERVELQVPIILSDVKSSRELVMLSVPSSGTRTLSKPYDAKEGIQK